MRKKWVISIVAAVIVLAGAYVLFDYYAGNHVRILEVFSSNKQAEPGEALSAKQLNKKWHITPDSKVYASVTTSVESVSMFFSKVEGEWNFNLKSPDKMTAEAKIDVKTLNSGNTQRDNDLKVNQLAVYAHPQAAFKLKSFEGWPTEWIEGQPVRFKMNGTLNVKGIDKDVQFDCEALHEGDQLKLKGKTVVTFQDFKMMNPHNVLLKTQDDITLNLQLVLSDQLPAADGKTDKKQ